MPDETTKDETTYTITVARNDPDGGHRVVEIGGYAVLREVLDDIMRDTDVQMWMEESDET